VVRKADLAGSRHSGAAAHHARSGNRVMRRAERALVEQAAAILNQSGDAVDLGGLDRLLKRQRRQNSGEPFGEHGLARAWRADHQHIVGTRRCHFQRAFRHSLAAHIAEIRRRGRFRLMAITVARRRREFPGAREHRHHFGQIARAVHIDAFHHRGLRRILGGQDDVGDAPVARADGHRKRAAYRTDGAIE
jgi:hypothetical protein